MVVVESWLVVVVDRVCIGVALDVPGVSGISVGSVRACLDCAGADGSVSEIASNSAMTTFLFPKSDFSLRSPPSGDDGNTGTSLFAFSVGMLGTVPSSAAI